MNNYYHECGECQFNNDGVCLKFSGHLVEDTEEGCDYFREKRS